MADRPHFQFDWYLIPKRAIYTAGALFFAGLLAGSLGLYILYFGWPFAKANPDAGSPAGAKFLSIEGEVRVIRAQTRQTIAATREVPLYPGDVVQTSADGRARLNMADGSLLAVRPNSVVTVRDNSGEGEKPNVRVAVERGQIKVRTEQQPAGASNVVETKLTRNRLAAQTGASFGVRDDAVEDIRVEGGSVETATRDGDKAVLHGGEYVQINQTGSVTRRERLLAAPVAAAPRDMETFVVGANRTTGLTLRWQPVLAEAATYQVEVAASPFFVAAGKVYERSKLSGAESTVGEVRPGVYFWRVRAVGASGQTSEWSEPQKFYVVQREADGPLSAADVTVEYVGGAVYLVRGRTQAGNNVRAYGRATVADNDGVFQLQMTIPAGARDFVLEISDQQGRRANYRLSLEANLALRK